MVGRYKYFNIYTTTNDFLTGSNYAMSDVFYGYPSIIDWFYDDATGCIRVLTVTSSVYRYIFDCLPSKLTVNKLSETVTKAEDQTMRITYTLDVEI